MEILGTGETDLARAADLLRQGKLVVFPTETLYGLAARVAEEDAVDRVAEIKGRLSGSPLPVLLGSQRVAERFARFDSAALRLADAFWPGPLTLVLPARIGLPAPLLGQERTVGLRISSHPVAAALAEWCEAITATSANRSGGRPPGEPADVSERIRDEAAALIDAGPLPGRVPSTVVRLAAGRAEILRRGVIPGSEIRAVAGGR